MSVLLTLLTFPRCNTYFSSSLLSDVAQTSHKSRSWWECCPQKSGHQSSVIFFLAAHVGISMNFLVTCESLQLIRQERSSLPPLKCVNPRHSYIYKFKKKKKFNNSSDSLHLFGLVSAAGFMTSVQKLQIWPKFLTGFSTLKALPVNIMTPVILRGTQTTKLWRQL